MVSSQISGLTKTNVQNAFKKQLLLPMAPPDVVPSEHVEFDFSDVFGPTPTQTSIEVNVVIPEGSISAVSDDKVYSEPMVILSRSHSLVGPSACVCQSPRIRKHILHETELELVECPSGADEEQEKPSSCNTEEQEVVSHCERVESVGLEDFDFLKVVGQGAFGKVFQVMKKGTSEIYAMKVVRKDKIIEKNYTEYMKSERDILTKVDHPFIVQLRYSFQVITVLILSIDSFLLTLRNCTFGSILS